MVVVPGVSYRSVGLVRAVHFTLIVGIVPAVRYRCAGLLWAVYSTRAVVVVPGAGRWHSVPMDISRLRNQLVTIDYTVDAVLGRIGEVGQAGLHRNSTMAADVMLDGAMDPLATAIRLFILQQRLPADLARSAFEQAWQDLLAAKIVSVDGDLAQAAVELRPYGSEDDGATGWLLSDLTPGLDGDVSPIRPDYVLGASPASLTLAQITMRSPVTRALDLGTGCGVQSYHLAHHAEQVIATDVNPRALQLARIGAELSHKHIDFRQGSLFDPVDGGFDLIVSNPPYVMSPPSNERLTYRETQFNADDLVAAIIRDAPRYLNSGGSAQLLTNWAITDQPWEDRLAGWVADSGCDLWAVERERLDRFAYIEMWLTDAGLAGSQQWENHYRQWLDYFDTLGIHEIGMGWILLTNSGRAQPDIRCESWPHAVAQPVGSVFAAHRAAIDAATATDEQLLASAPRMAEVVSEAIGQPGAVDPEYLVLRQRSGLLRGMTLTTVTGAVLGALDGELTLGQIIAAVAQLLDLSATDVAAEALPAVRAALREQYLLPG